MAQKRRKFSPQYKAEAVAFVLETGRPITEVAADLGINAGTLLFCQRRWDQGIRTLHRRERSGPNQRARRGHRSFFLDHWRGEWVPFLHPSNHITRMISYHCIYSQLHT